MDSPLAGALRRQQCDYNRKRQNEAEQSDLRHARHVHDGNALRHVVTFDQYGGRAIPDESAERKAQTERLGLRRDPGIADNDRFCGGVLESNEV